MSTLPCLAALVLAASPAWDLLPAPHQSHQVVSFRGALIEPADAAQLTADE